MAKHTPVHWMGRLALTATLTAFLLGWWMFLSRWLTPEGYVPWKAVYLSGGGLIGTILLAFALDLFRPRRIEHHTWLVLATGLLTTGSCLVFSLFGDRLSWDVPLGIYLAFSSGILILLLWLLFLSGYRYRTRLGYMIVLAVLMGVGASLLRLERWNDFGKPVLAWRWKAPDVGSSSFDSATHSPTISQANLIATPSDWPQFLGPDRDGVLGSLAIQDDWTSSPPRLLWKKSVGEGFGGFSVVGDFAMTLEQRGESECTICYRVQTGETVWIHAEPARFESAMGGIGPRSNPTIRDGVVYVQGATGLLLALDGKTGQLLWKVDIVRENGAAIAEHGMAGSPLVTENHVIVNAGGTGGHSLVAYDCRDGKRIWSAGDEAAGYASPILTELHGTAQVIYFHADGIAGHLPTTGQRLWSYPLSNGPKINCTQPIVLDATAGDLFVVNGYGAGKAVRIRVQPSGGSAWRVTEIWSSRGLRSVYSNAVAKQGYVYGLDEGILTCLDLATGARKWKRGRHGKGQLLLLGDRLLIQEGEGGLALVAARPDKYELLTTTAGLEGPSWNSPALAGRLLLIRNQREAACLEMPIEDR